MVSGRAMKESRAPKVGLPVKGELAVGKRSCCVVDGSTCG